MTNHHVPGILQRLLDMVHAWRERQHNRRELAAWTERDMRDAGVSPGDVFYESAKPFWRA